VADNRIVSIEAKQQLLAKSEIIAKSAKLFAATNAARRRVMSLQKLLRLPSCVMNE